MRFSKIKTNNEAKVFFYVLAVEQYIRYPDVSRINVNKFDSTILCRIPYKKFIPPILK